MSFEQACSGLKIVHDSFPCQINAALDSNVNNKKNSKWIDHYFIGWREENPRGGCRQNQGVVPTTDGSARSFTTAEATPGNVGRGGRGRNNRGRG